MSEETNPLQAALQLPERIDPRFFAQFLRRIAISLKERNQTPFSEDDVKALLDQFEMTTADFEEMFSSCQYVLQQAACFNFDSEKISTFVTNNGASEAVAGCFSAVWDAEGDNLLDALKARPISDNALSTAGWRLNLKADSSADGKERTPVMLLNFDVAKDPITIQFTHQELSHFYEQIEAIQQQIDKMT